jgi:hypothetical protein
MLQDMLKTLKIFPLTKVIIMAVTVQLQALIK